MKRKFIRISIILLVLTLPLAAWRLYLAHVINRQLAEVRAAGLPVNGEELNRWYPAVPDDRNAARALTQAFKLRCNYPDSRSNSIFNFKLPGRREALTAEQTRLLEGYVAMNSAMLDQAKEALELPASRYPVDWALLAYTPLPHLTWLKNLAEIHQYSAWLTLQAGGLDGTSSNVVAMLALARTLDEEPCLISQLVRLQLIRMASATLERRANAGGFGPAEIDRLAEAFARTVMTNLATRALIGERAMIIPCFRMTREEADRIHAPANVAGQEKDSVLPCRGPFLLRLIGYYELDFGSFLIAMNKGIALTRRPPPDNLVAGGFFARAGEGAAKRHRTISGLTLAAYAGVASRENEGIACQRLAVTALALERFRNQNGQVPEKLEELVPQFLPEAPVDPFDGSLLRYRRNAAGYIVYSVGRDLSDDGGLGISDKNESDGKVSCDITFTVER
jgi:hypothetical protein